MIDIKADLEYFWMMPDFRGDLKNLKIQNQPVAYERIQEMVDGTSPSAAFVEFFILLNQLVVFVLRAGEKDPVGLQHPISDEQLMRLLSLYHREIIEYPIHGDIGMRWQELASFLLEGVFPYIKGADLVYLVPHNSLRYLPFHAMEVDGNYLIDYFPIAYVSDMILLDEVIRRRAANGPLYPAKSGIDLPRLPRNALVVGNPTLDLPQTENEALQVAKRFATRPLIGKEATKVSIRTQLKEKDLIHLACHSYHNPLYPLESGLVLAGKRALMAGDIMSASISADLITLSACELALLSINGTGLPTSFLRAGASSVLGTLWLVNDETAGDMALEFYNQWLGDKEAGMTPQMNKAAALREAMRGIRKVKKHPYHWAAFALNGMVL